MQMYLKIEAFNFALHILEFFFYITDFAMNHKGCSSKSYLVTLEIAFRNFKGFELLNRPFAVFFAMINVRDRRRTTECLADCSRLSEIVGRWNVLVNYRLLANSTEATISVRR